MTDWLRNLFKQCSKGIWADLFLHATHRGCAAWFAPLRRAVLANAKLESGDARALQREPQLTLVSHYHQGQAEKLSSLPANESIRISFFSSLGRRIACARMSVFAPVVFLLSQGICKWESYKQVAMAARRDLTVTECAKLPREAPCSINATLREWNLVFAQSRCHLI